MTKPIYKLISKEDAKAQGLTHYFTNKPCKNGHINERLVSTGHCYECAKSNWQNAARKNPHKYKEWYHSNEDNYRKGLLASARSNAKRRNLTFNLSIDDIQIPKECPILGIPLFPSKNGRYTYNSPTIDRINNNIGYEKTNIHIISWRANKLKSDASLIELKSIVDYLSSR